MNREIAQAVFPDWESLPSVADLEKRFPPRDLPPGGMVTRVGPSPTGMMHLGGLYTGLINHVLARQTGGVFFLRIEDTDQKRTVEGAMETIVDSLGAYDLLPGEGVLRSPDGSFRTVGEYGPYVQSQRGEIYRAVAFDLLVRGLVYPCFLTSEEIEAMRAKQQETEARIGVYDEWACWRDADPRESLRQGRPYVLRVKAPPAGAAPAEWDDGVRGRLTLPALDLDSVLVKSDGLPTYHFAHLVDDHFMRTTDVIRGEEWISSVPLHLHLFSTMGWEPPRYSHVAAILKQDGSSKRKLSKRKDPEADVRFYWQHGFPREAVIEYLLNLANSNFEDWRRAHPEASWREFVFSLAKMGVGGPLADLKKLESISREVLHLMPEEELTARAFRWAADNDPELASMIERDRSYAGRALTIDRGSVKPAKRLVTFADLRTQLGPYFDEMLPAPGSYPFPENVSAEDRRAILDGIAERYREGTPPEEVFPLIREMAVGLGYAGSPKEYKADPSAFKGHVGDVAMVLRVALFGSTQSPDLGQVMLVLGEEGVRRRCRRAL